jgi:hypothetical protein
LDSTIRTGGILSELNNNIPIPFIFLGIILTPTKYRWISLCIFLPALVLTGSKEWIPVLLVMSVYWLFNNRISKWFLIPLGFVALFIFIFRDNIELLYSGFFARLLQVGNGSYDRITSIFNKDYLTLLGHGWGYDYLRTNNLHFMPLITLYEAGIAGLCAYLGIIGYLFWKPKTRLLGLILACLGLVDHYLWTQLFFLFTVLISKGVSENA